MYIRDVKSIKVVCKNTMHFRVILIKVISGSCMIQCHLKVNDVAIYVL